MTDILSRNEELQILFDIIRLKISRNEHLTKIINSIIEFLNILNDYYNNNITKINYYIDLFLNSKTNLYLLNVYLFDYLCNQFMNRNLIHIFNIYINRLIYNNKYDIIIYLVNYYLFIDDTIKKTNIPTYTDFFNPIIYELSINKVNILIDIKNLVKCLILIEELVLKNYSEIFNIIENDIIQFFKYFLYDDKVLSKYGIYSHTDEDEYFHIDTYCTRIEPVINITELNGINILRSIINSIIYHFELKRKEILEILEIYVKSKYGFGDDLIRTISDFL